MLMIVQTDAQDVKRPALPIVKIHARRLVVIVRRLVLRRVRHIALTLA